MKNMEKIGVVHLPPLLGAPGFTGNQPEQALHQAGFQAIKEVKALEKAGFTSVVLENFGDAPFFKDSVPAETVASMGAIAAAIRQSTKLRVGINLLRNDARSALAVATVTGCDFIRVNVLSGVAATDQGIIEGQAADLIREKNRLNSNVQIYADIHVKHAKSLNSNSIQLAIEETAHRGGADAIILTGDTTGRNVDSGELKEAFSICQKMKIPLLIGSGLNSDNAADLIPFCHGFLIGSAIRKRATAGEALDQAALNRFSKILRSAKIKKIAAPSKKKKKKSSKKKPTKKVSRKKKTVRKPSKNKTRKKR